MIHERTATILRRTLRKMLRRGLAPQPPARPRAPIVTSAELAQCNCPDPCERDHDND